MRALRAKLFTLSDAAEGGAAQWLGFGVRVGLLHTPLLGRAARPDASTHRPSRPKPAAADRSAAFNHLSCCYLRDRHGVAEDERYGPPPHGKPHCSCAGDRWALGSRLSGATLEKGTLTPTCALAPALAPTSAVPC